MDRPIVIAVDGPSGSGKSSVSRAVASQLGLDYLDTGAMYRAMTWWMLHNGVDVHDPDAVAQNAPRAVIVSGMDPLNPTITVDGTDVSIPIREAEVTGAVSLVSAVPAVRSLLVAKQQQAASGADRGIVIEGRDIGTVVLPDADLKIYLTADQEVRAARRAAEDAARAGGNDVDAAVLEATAAALARRDRIDSSREVSPLAKADDAIHIDASALTLQEVIDSVLGLAQEVAAT